MICPSCNAEIDPAGWTIAPPLAICPVCERSLVVGAGGERIATAADVQDLTAEQKLALSQLRIETRKARKAYFAAHH